MSTVLSMLENYLADLTDNTFKPAPDPVAASRLPMFVGQIYDPFRAHLFGRDVLLMLWKRKQHPVPSEVASHVGLVQKYLHEEMPVFVFPSLLAYERGRLMQQGLAFIVPEKQIYLPPRLVDLRESNYRAVRNAAFPGSFLSSPAQAMLLYYLQKPEAGLIATLQEWAKKLGYSAMTITRACQDLEKNDLCKPQPRHRSLTPIFTAQGRELWERAKPLLRNPVERRAHVLHYRLPEPTWLQSGLNALAQFSDLAEDANERVVALSTSAYRAAREENKFEELPFDEKGTVTVEQWRYPPAPLSPDGKTVDRLSLWLSLQDNHDERVQSALETMMEGIKW